MRSTVSLEQGLKNLRALCGEFGHVLPAWNEADTRFQFIDRLLVECFGWPRELIHTESRLDEEYRDYVLGTPSEIVWEAKRSGVHFDFPADADGGLVQSLSAITKVSKSADAAIRQAQGYCNTAGLEFAVICNGDQLVALIGQRIGASWLDGRALISRSLTQLMAEFPTYWQCLSPDGLFERRLATSLGYKIETNIPRKLSSRLLKYPAFRYKSELQANLRAISELLLEDIVRTEPMKKRFYNECYAETGALSRDALISHRILQARYASLFPPEGGSPVLEPAKGQEDAQGLTRQVLTEALAKRPIVLLGDVGVGKTSFLEDLIYIRANKEFENSLFVYIDLGSRAALNTDIRAFVVNEIERQLYAKHGVDVYEDAFVRGVYDMDIKRFRGSYRASSASDPAALEYEIRRYLGEIIADKPEHLRRAVEHLALGRKQQIIFMIDNADQRNTNIQQEAFLISQELAQTWNALVFIAVRPHELHPVPKTPS
jgi:hypothetical protein